MNSCEPQLVRYILRYLALSSQFITTSEERGRPRLLCSISCTWYWLRSGTDLSCLRHTVHPHQGQAVCSWPVIWGEKTIWTNQLLLAGILELGSWETCELAGGLVAEGLHDQIRAVEFWGKCASSSYELEIPSIGRWSRGHGKRRNPVERGRGKQWGMSSDLCEAALGHDAVWVSSFNF